MSPAAWLALGGLFLTVALQTVGLAFWLGGMSARLRQVEGRSSGDDCAAQLAAMKATLEGLKENVTQRFDALEKTVSGLASRPGPRRRASE